MVYFNVANRMSEKGLPRDTTFPPTSAFLCQFEPGWDHMEAYYTKKGKKVSVLLLHDVLSRCSTQAGKINFSIQD